MTAFQETSEQAETSDESSGDARRSGSWLKHPIAYLITTVILLAVFAWPYVIGEQRSAPTRDPAFYTWRTEALFGAEPADVLEMDGALGMYDRGYRMGTPLLGAFLRTIGGFSVLRWTVVLTVALPLVLSLLVGGIAERLRPEPFTFHVAAMATAGLLLTPPFVGYLDNLLSIVLLTAALPLVARANTSNASRFGAGLCLVAAGFVHPTSLATFCAVAIVATIVSALVPPRSISRSIRTDLPALATVALSAGIVAASWQLGVWGGPASLTHSALPPPYSSDQFLGRLNQWLEAMNWGLNAPLLVAGVAVLCAAAFARRDRLTTLTLLWLLPLVGVFGWTLGLAFPYYRFLNATAAWVIAYAIGAVATVAWAWRRIKRPLLLPLCVALIAAVFALTGMNLYLGIDRYGSDATKNRGGWLSATEQLDLDALRSALEAGNQDDPIVFVVDFRPQPAAWAGTKLAGNTARYAVPRERLSDVYMYLGDLENLIREQPTVRNDPTYDRVSKALLDEIEAGIDSNGETLVVVASMFNRTGDNRALARGHATVAAGPTHEVWALHEGVVSTAGQTIEIPMQNADGSPGGAGGLGLVLLLIPGIVFIASPEEIRRGGLVFGLIPALSAALLIVSAVILPAVLRSPLTTPMMWGALVLATAVALAGRFGTHRGAQTKDSGT